jgi:hypothetical protein
MRNLEKVTKLSDKQNVSFFSAGVRKSWNITFILRITLLACDICSKISSSFPVNAFDNDRCMILLETRKTYFNC